MLGTEGIAMLLWQGEALAFVESNHEDAGLRWLNNRNLAEGF